MAELSLSSFTNTSIEPNRMLTLLEDTTYVGIDFGTSTSVVSLVSYVGGKVETKSLKIKQKSKYNTDIEDDLVPTVIALYNNMVLVGKGAEELKFDLRKDIEVFYNFKMDVGEQHFFPASKISTIRTPKEAVSMFVKFLKSRIEQHCTQNNLPLNIKYSFSIPASFESNQRREFISALKDNQIDVTQSVLIDEPNAAFISYLRSRFREGSPLILPTSVNLKYLVFDFGAGTCDVSLIEVGSTFEGVSSKNLAISKFEKLGGRDIDAAIAKDILLPQFLKQNDLDEKTFAKVEVEQIIIPRLLKTAENLKIEICKTIAIQFSHDDFQLPPRATSEESITLRPNVLVSTSVDEFRLTEATISYQDFHEIISVFTSDDEDALSIFNPIKDVLKKINLTVDDVFAVLFIGGSCKNPYIQSAVANYFDGSSKLVPKNLQTHVSEGTALNSLFINGFGQTILKQITSNTILLETKDGKIPLVRHGVEIPSSIKQLDTNVMTWREGQDIRLPLYSQDNNLLYEIFLKHPSGDGFAADTNVQITYEIDVNKNLDVKATADNHKVEVEIENPFFAGSSLSPTQRTVKRLERQLAGEKLVSIASEKSYTELVKAYEEDNQYLLAAKLMKEAKKLYKDLYSNNAIGLMFSNANDTENAKKYYKLDLAESPRNPTALFNYSYTLSHSDPEKITTLQQALDINPDHTPSLIEMSRLIKRDDPDQAKGMELRAFNILKEKLDNNTLPEWGKSWLRAIARTTGNYDVARSLKTDPTQNDLFDDRVVVKGGITNYK